MPKKGGRRRRERERVEGETRRVELTLFLFRLAFETEVKSVLFELLMLGLIWELEVSIYSPSLILSFVLTLLTKSRRVSSRFVLVLPLLVSQDTPTDHAVGPQPSEAPYSYHSS